MLSRSRARRRFTLSLEILESRLALTSVTIAMDPTLDQTGAQIQTVMAYGSAALATTGVLDTGASVISFSADDRASFDSAGTSIPVKVTSGAQAAGIGGDITGDVSQPAMILADGIHAANITYDSLGFPQYDVQFNNTSARALGVQAFLGTSTGSSLLPTITGTPIFNPTRYNGNKGLAALVNWQGFTDPVLGISEPDVYFVQPSTKLSAAAGTTPPVTIALGSYGPDNHLRPANDVTASPNPIDPNVMIQNQGNGAMRQHFLLDTGSQITVISTALAQRLNLNLNNPTTTLDVQGVGGSQTLPGFTIDSIKLPVKGGGTLTFTSVPVYVLDAAPGLDGILGMNLFNLGASMLYNPFAVGGPSLTATFFTNPAMDSGGGAGGLFETVGVVRGNVHSRVALPSGVARVTWDASDFSTPPDQASKMLPGPDQPPAGLQYQPGAGNLGTGANAAGSGARTVTGIAGQLVDMRTPGLERLVAAGAAFQLEGGGRQLVTAVSRPADAQAPTDTTEEPGQPLPVGTPRAGVEGGSPNGQLAAAVAQFSFDSDHDVAGQLPAQLIDMPLPTRGSATPWQRAVDACFTDVGAATCGHSSTRAFDVAVLVSLAGAYSAAQERRRREQKRRLSSTYPGEAFSWRDF
jgi:predicted aspartyl protease